MAPRSGQFGPVAYTEWRTTTLGALTEAIERRLILRLAGDVRGRRVLDVGCGDGALTRAFGQLGASSVVGCDNDPRMIARAEAGRHNADVHYLLADAERLPFRECSFDLVTMVTVLAFQARPQLALREIARVLKPGGHLVIGDLGRWSVWAACRRLRGWLERASPWKAASFRSARQLRRLVEGAGLRVNHLSGAVYYPRSAAIARVMAPFDPRLGGLTTFGAAFLALRAAKDIDR